MHEFDSRYPLQNKKGPLMIYVWIYQKNKEEYISLMNIECGGPVIHKETDEKLQVDFCDAAMRDWVQCGYWYEWD